MSEIIKIQNEPRAEVDVEPAHTADTPDTPEQELGLLRHRLQDAEQIVTDVLQAGRLANAFELADLYRDRWWK